MTCKLALLLLLLTAPVLAGPPVVLELFTSEGCSSCPPAEALFAKLAAEPDVIALAYHVDYWNKLGWTDPFSRAEWSRRQGRYVAAWDSQEVYTPMLVAGGTAHCVGSDEKQVRDLVDGARKSKVKPVTLTVGKPAGGKLKVAAKFDSPESIKMTVSLILFEDGLSTKVAAGENAGETLAHERVVRALVEADETEFALDPSWKVERLGVVALVQDSHFKVLGAALKR